MPEERVEKIAETAQKKIKYLQLFQEGKKIWKREKYLEYIIDALEHGIEIMTGEAGNCAR